MGQLFDCHRSQSNDIINRVAPSRARHPHFLTTIFLINQATQRKYLGTLTNKTLRSLEQFNNRLIPNPFISNQGCCNRRENEFATLQHPFA